MAKLNVDAIIRSEIDCERQQQKYPILVAPEKSDIPKGVVNSLE